MWIKWDPSHEGMLLLSLARLFCTSPTNTTGGLEKQEKS